MKRILVTFVTLLLSATTTFAVPNTMNYQGQLFLNGQPTNGPVSITFRMFDAQTGGAELWTETDNVTVTGGLFTTILGDGTAFPATLFSSQIPWLEMEVNGTVQAPRTRFQSVPYALVGPAAGGESLWETDGTNVWRDSGNVGIGTPAPIRPFMLERSFTGDWIAHIHNTDAANGHGLLVQAGQTNAQRIAAFQDKDGNDRVSFYSGGRVNIIGSLGIGPATPWSSDGIYLDAGSQQSTIAWDNRISAGFQMFQTAGSNIFNFTSSGGGSSETWNFISAGLGNLMTIGSTITMNRPLTVNGSLNVSGTKCRVVTTPFGQLQMNAVESAHALFMDDEPTARLVNGRCRVNLSPTFLATVTVNGKYPLAVNVTFYGPHGGGWYVERDAGGFTVIDPNGSNTEFSWQAIARQKGYEDVNLDPVTQTAAK